MYTLDFGSFQNQQLVTKHFSKRKRNHTQVVRKDKYNDSITKTEKAEDNWINVSYVVLLCHATIYFVSCDPCNVSCYERGGGGGVK